MLLTANHSWPMHHLRNLLLVALSLFLLPFSAIVVTVARFLHTFQIVRTPKIKPAIRNDHQIRILVTGVGMAKGLFLCRSFYLGGCQIVAVDFKKHADVPCGRFSRAVDGYYSVSSPQEVGIEAYIAEMIKIIKRERIDLCVTCSGVATAIEDAKLVEFLEKDTSCKAFQLNEDIVHSLDDKFEFMRQTDDFGLVNPEWYSLRSRDEIPSIVSKLQMFSEKDRATKFIAKNVGMDDASRGAIPILDPSQPNEIASVLASLEYNDEKKWILQEYFPSGEEYCTHAIVVDGTVKAFTACPSASVLMHYELLHPDSWQFKEMLIFTQTYASALYKKYGRFAGHLSFDFLVRTKPMEFEGSTGVVPIECNPRCHTATVLFRNREVELTEAYLSIFREKGSTDRVLEVERRQADSFYWMAHDILVFMILPQLRTGIFDLIRQFPQIFRNQVKCVVHLITWKDPTFEWWDPMPWFALNHIYWPLNLLEASLTGTKWKQLNVSTTKMFNF